VLDVGKDVETEEVVAAAGVDNDVADNGVVDNEVVETDAWDGETGAPTGEHEAEAAAE